MRHSLALCLAIPLITAAVACGTADPGQTAGTVEITVMGRPLVADVAGRKWFDDKVAAFEAANPGIKIKPSDATWDARSFAARLAGGNVETVIRVPLTEPAALIARTQVADITTEAKALPSWASFDPKVLEPVTKDGKVYGVPENMYALGVVYNRELFTKAGLDPDRPPTTWDGLRAAAKQIKDRTGAIGFGAMTTKNAGGWHLTAQTYSYGGTMERVEAGQAVASFADGPAEQVLNLLKQMRWTDDSMGTQQLRSQDDMNKDYAAAKVAMQINAPDYYAAYVQNFGGDPAKFGMAALPQGGGNTTLVGGTIDMISAKATPQQRAAAVKWIDYIYLKVISDPAAAVEYNKSRAADNLPVGVPVLPLFTQDTQDKVNAAIASYVNVPTKNFKPFLEGTKNLRYGPEPAVAAQELYGVLDATVQAVLTKPDADVHALLSEASDRVNAILKQKQQ
ncbi:ABC transporter substrate-binding protein [Actinocrispum wychmicini]|uniref:ABC-type glycerol-3-phosphate transport system substrate-binding protein n=1 Tax=Actinocrispum wychmicini TaxID=1213861 RepID=A0A4R2JAS3_9PSEU|nr:extracellular solute-binding protein [Actinocrispum wychmicini]TCO55894.1 ABC-type glycerol-3-phosphate transport system substrate-binding protein [Actinocrispum wychmicini]